MHALSGLAAVDIINLTGTPVTSVASSGLTSISWTTDGTLMMGRPLSAAFAIEGGERIVVLGPNDAAVPFDRTADVYIP